MRSVRTLLTTTLVVLLAPAARGVELRNFDDAALRARLAEAGRQRVLERYTWRACAEATVAQYRALLAEQGAAC